MTGGLSVIGVDPGPTPGFVVLRYGPGTRRVGQHDVDVMQTSLDLALEAFTGLLDRARRKLYDERPIVAVEKFVVGRGSQRAGHAGEQTRALVESIVSRCLGNDCRVYVRTASQVKTWATDRRLEKAGLLEPTKGMRHARDAARHALFAAVLDGGRPDPLSRHTT